MATEAQLRRHPTEEKYFNSKLRCFSFCCTGLVSPSGWQKEFDLADVLHFAVPDGELSLLDVICETF